MNLGFRLPKTQRELIPLLQSRGLHLSRERGQNFLCDRNVIEAIVRDAAVQPDDLVLEIGPGAGAITEHLMQAARLVLAVDIDRGMVDLLRESLDPSPNLLLVEADIMGRHNSLNTGLLAIVHDLLSHGWQGQYGDHDQPSQAQLLTNQPLADHALDSAKLALLPSAPRIPAPERLRVVANLPYSISSPLLIGLLESALPLSDMTLLVQREVADKLRAKVGDREFGLLSLLVGLRADVKLVRKVAKQLFWPVPKVESALIRVTPHHRADDQRYQRIKKLAHGLFQYRRKSLAAGLRHAFGLDASGAIQACETAELSPSCHAEGLGEDALDRLALALESSV